MLPKDCLSGLTQSRLKELLSYDPTTGVFRWAAPTSPRTRAGDLAGNICKSTGYHMIKVDGRSYLAHRLAFLYVTGGWPRARLDHENLDKTDNRWGNLREATTLQNAWNRGLTASNTSGLKGVCRSRGGWQSNIRVAGKLLFLGRHPTPEQAHAAYVAAAAHHFGTFARAA